MSHSANYDIVYNYIADALGRDEWRGFHVFLPTLFIAKNKTHPFLKPMLSCQFWCDCENRYGHHQHRHTVYVTSAMHVGPQLLRLRKVGAYPRAIRLRNARHFVNAVLFVCSHHDSDVRNVSLTELERNDIIAGICKEFPECKRRESPPPSIDLFADSEVSDALLLSLVE